MELKDKLYYSDAYLRSFEAKVISCVAVKDRWYVQLNQTAFFPEGGGQPGDTGYIGPARVIDTVEKDGEIIHITDAAAEEGQRVLCEVDWERRFDFMQQHSGEHIFTGCAAKRYGCTNVGFHIGADIVTLDLDKELSEEDIEAIENEVNEAIWKNIPVRAWFPAAEELETLEYRSKKELSGDVRIVSVEGYDHCACCAVHVSRTGEIGLLKCQSFKRYKGGVRITIACGKRALEDYRRKLAASARISELLSAKIDETAEAVSHLAESFENTTYKFGKLQEELWKQKAQSVNADGEKVCALFDAVDAEGVWKIASKMSERFEAAAVFALQEQGNYAYAVMSRDGELKAFTAEMNSALSGRGGGKPPLVRGSAACKREDIVRFFENKGWQIRFM